MQPVQDIVCSGATHCMPLRLPDPTTHIIIFTHLHKKPIHEYNMPGHSADICSTSAVNGL